MMKKRILGLLLTLCLLAALLPAAFAAEGLSLTVTSQAELSDALNRAEPVSAIRVTEDFTVTEESLVLFDEAHFPNYRSVTLTVEEGVTLTVGEGGVIGCAWFSFEGDWNDGPEGRLINNGTVIVRSGGAIEGEFSRNNGELVVERGGEAVCATENEGTVTVHAGGVYATTQGNVSVNRGVVSIEDGARMISRFGSTVENAAGGTILLDGDFYCGCAGEELWFRNGGTVTGQGRVILYAADMEVMPTDLDVMLARMMDALGQETRFEDWDDVGIYRLLTVSDAEGLRLAAMEERTIKGEPVEGNMDTLIELEEETQLELREGIGGMVTIIVPESASLVIQNEGNLTAGIENYGEITVEAGGVLATVMGGPILNRGGIEIKPGAELHSQMGQAVVNEGELVLDGAFFCGSFDIDGNNALWFENNEEAGGELHGSGFAVVYVAGTDREEPSEVIDEMCTRMRGLLGIKPIHVFAQATNERELVALNASTNEAIRGVYLATTDGPDPEGFAMLRLSQNLTMKKALWIGANTDLVLDNGATLSLDALSPIDDGKTAPVKSNLLMSWMGRIVTEAAGAPDPEAPAGGTLLVGGVKVLSGTAEDALLRPTRDIAYLVAPYYLGPDAFPAQPEWLYVSEGAAAELGTGELPRVTDLAGESRQLSLIVGEFAELSVRGRAAAGYVELRGPVTLEEGASLTAWDVFYYNEALVSGGAITVENDETYECRFDLDLHDFQSWSNGVWHYPTDRDGRVYFEENGVPFAPTREGYVFEGWEIGSGWGVPGDQLTAFAVQEDAEGHFVPKPTAFPIIVRARWRWVGGPIPGDVNGDGRAELLDAQLLFAFTSGQPLQAEEEGLDLNADGHVNSRDALLLLRRLAAG